MSIKAEFPDDDGFSLFDEWSAQAPNYKASAAQQTWRSIKAAGGTSIATLFFEAKKGGYVPGAVVDPGPADIVADSRQARVRADKKRDEQASIEAAHKEAAERAKAMWDASASASNEAVVEHPYLRRKGVLPFDVRLGRDGWLLVPLRDGEGKLWSLQRIAPDQQTKGPDKLLIKGGRKSGLWHAIGVLNDAPVILLGEGYATCASLHQATGRPVVVAFDAGNLVHVAKSLRLLHPKSLIAVCGDDDVSKVGGNVGRAKALAAAKAVGGLAVFPVGLPRDGSDFNDLHAHGGLDGVRAVVEAALAGYLATQAAAVVRDEMAHRFDRFRVDDGGLWFSPPGDDGEGKPRRVCGPIYVVGLARDVKDNAAALVLQFDTEFRKGRRWLMPLAMLSGDGAAYRTALLSQGFMAPTDPNRRRWLTDYLQSRQNLPLLRHVPRVGWHGRCYVLPNETLGELDGEPVIFHSEKGTEVNFNRRGSLGEWQEQLAKLCVGNSRLAFAVSTALAGPLLAFAPGTTGGGFHYFGPTSTGKTTGLLIAASVWGKGAEKDPEAFMQGWKSTDNGLEGQAEQHNDLTLVLDELGSMDANKAGDAAYMLADGMGKTRMAQGGGQRPKATWRLLYLSSGELTLAQHMESVGKKMRGGQEIRLIPVPAEVAAGSTLETLQDFATGHAFSNWVQKRAARTYGTVGRMWLESLVDRASSIAADLNTRMDAIERAMVPSSAVGQIKRAGRRFALVAAAGEMATEAGLTGWPEGEATRAARICFDAWIASRGGAGSSDEIQMVRQVIRFFQAHGEGRFTIWERAESDDSHNPKTLSRAGFRKKVKSVDPLESSPPLDYYVLTEVFRTEVCQGFDYKAVCRVLAEHGCLRVEAGHFDVTARLPGIGKARCYHITSKLFELDIM